MDIVKQAISIEEEGERTYRKCAETARLPGLTRIFNMLADSELEHKGIFEALVERENLSSSGSGLMGRAKAIFKDMGDEKGLQLDDIVMTSETETFHFGGNR